MNTERKPVDVLAEMDNAAEHLEAVKHYGTCDDLREARDAVAELIEAANAAREWIDGCGAQGGASKVVDDINAALARCGVQS